MDFNANVVYSMKARVGDITSLDIPYERPLARRHKSFVQKCDLNSSPDLIVIHSMWLADLILEFIAMETGHF